MGKAILKKNKRTYHESIFINAYYEPVSHFTLRNLDYFEIIFLDSGQLSVTCDYKNFILFPGDIIIVCPHETVAFSNTHKEKSSCIVLQFYPEVLSMGANSNPMLQSLLFHAKNDNRYFSLREENNSSIMNSFIAIFNERKTIHSNSEVSLRAHTLKIISWIIEKQHINSQEYTFKKCGKSQKKIEEILDYIKNHYTENLQLSEIAKQNYISYSHLSRQFKAATGLTFNAYINEKRVHKSAFMLITTDYPISEIASVLGYCDQSYYTVQFLLYYKMTPSEFRRRFKTKTPLYELYVDDN